MRNRIKVMITTFTCVTTCVVFVSALFMEIFWGEVELGTEILWQILGVSFLCSISTFIYPDREMSKKASTILMVVHYLIINAIVLGCGLKFGWFYADNLDMVLGMLFIIAVVFVITVFTICYQQKHVADILNERLKEYQEEKKDL